jgi:hypothetical protein
MPSKHQPMLQSESIIKLTTLLYRTLAMAATAHRSALPTHETEFVGSSPVHAPPVHLPRKIVMVPEVIVPTASQGVERAEKLTAFLYRLCDPVEFSVARRLKWAVRVARGWSSNSSRSGSDHPGRWSACWSPARLGVLHL